MTNEILNVIKRKTADKFPKNGRDLYEVKCKYWK